MFDMNQPNALAAAVEAPRTGRILVPGNILSAEVADADERACAETDLGALISRERLRAAGARAERDATEASGAGARVCCVMCFNKGAAAQADENAVSGEDAA